MDNSVVYLNLPVKIKGFVVHNSSDEYDTIVLNCRHSYNMNLQTFSHELKHIKNNDFKSYDNVNLIESLTH